MNLTCRCITLLYYTSDRHCKEIQKAMRTNAKLCCVVMLPVSAMTSPTVCMTAFNDNLLNLPKNVVKTLMLNDFVYMDVFLICFSSKHLRNWAPLTAVIKWVSVLGWYWLFPQPLCATYFLTRHFDCPVANGMAALSDEDNALQSLSDAHGVSAMQ